MIVLYNPLVLDRGHWPGVDLVTGELPEERDLIGLAGSGRRHPRMTAEKRQSLAHRASMDGKGRGDTLNILPRGFLASGSDM